MNEEARLAYEQYLLVRGEAWRQDLARFDAGAVAEVVEGLRRIRRRVRAELAALDTTDAADILDAERLARLETWIDTVTAAGASLTGGVALESGIQAALASATAAVSCLSIDGHLSAIQDVGLTREQVRLWFGSGHEVIEGYDMKRLLAGMAQQQKDVVMDSLRASVTLGSGVEKSARRLVSDALESGFAVSDRAAVSIVRTSIQAGAVQAMDAVYDANRSLFRAWRWVAKLDSRTCHVCAALDGRIYEWGKGPRLPGHARCRCLRQPLLKTGADLGAPDDDVQRLSRTWIEREIGSVGTGGRRIITTQATDRWYGEFFAELRPDLQDAIVGARRAEALRSGRIRWGDLVDEEGRYRSLQELGLKGAGTARPAAKPKPRRSGWPEKPTQGVPLSTLDPDVIVPF